MPEDLNQAPQQIAIDSDGTVFFNENFNRLVPSTNTVTIFDNVNPFLLEIDSGNVIRWVSGGQGGTIT